MGSSGAEPFKCCKVLHVEGIRDDQTGSVTPLSFRGLDKHRQPCKPAIVKDPVKGLLAETSAADVLVSIHAASARLFRVVRMKHFEPLDADAAIKGVEGVAVPSISHEVVAGSHQMTGIEAHPDAR